MSGSEQTIIGLQAHAFVLDSTALSDGDNEPSEEIEQTRETVSFAFKRGANRAE